MLKSKYSNYLKGQKSMHVKQDNLKASSLNKQFCKLIPQGPPGINGTNGVNETQGPTGSSQISPDCIYKSAPCISSCETFKMVKVIKFFDKLEEIINNLESNNNNKHLSTLIN